MKKLSHVVDEKVELENPIVLKLNSHLLFWKRYVDDALTIVKKGPSYRVLPQLNSFYPNIQFTFEREPRGGIPFLDILVIRKKVALKQQFTKTVQIEALFQLVLICTNTWIQGTFKDLVHRVYYICSTEYLLRKEWLHLEKMFIYKNNYPRWITKQILSEKTTKKKQHKQKQ